MNTRFNNNKTLENCDVLSSRIAQHSHENNYIDCKTARIFALVANEIACTLRAKELKRGANVEWIFSRYTKFMQICVLLARELRKQILYYVEFSYNASCT